MIKRTMLIAAALCAALTVSVGAGAQEASCRAETAGQLLCQRSTLCQCQYFSGGALSESAAGYRWDCSLFRPRCEAASELSLDAPAMMVKSADRTAEGQSDEGDLQSGERYDSVPDLVAAEGLDPDTQVQRDVGWSRSDEPAPRVAAKAESSGDFDLIAAEGLGPVLEAPDASLSTDPAAGTVVLAALTRWAQALWSAPQPQRRVSKAPVPRLGDRFTQQMAQAEQTEVRLAMQIAALKETLGQERRRIADLEDERNDLERRRAQLNRQLHDMGEIQQAALDRLADHTSLEIAVFEETVAMTGVDVAVLLPEDRDGGLAEAQGGPFIPEQILPTPDPVEAAVASLSMLDDRIARWDRLQELLRSLPLAAPLEQYRISSPFGPRKDPVNGRLSRHYGLDFKAKLSTPVLSTAPGEVVFAAWRGRYGRLVEIDHGHGIRTRYAHLHKILVKPGQVVGHRETIGLLGSSGRSTGPHLHYEVLVNGKPHDPMNFLEAGIHVFKMAGRDDDLSGQTTAP